MKNDMKALVIIVASLILIGMVLTAYAEPELVEMKLEVYIFNVNEGIIRMCVDIYCHAYYAGNGSISETFLVPPGQYSGLLEWSHTKANCDRDFDNVCAASGKVIVPREKDGPLTMQVWNQYDLGAQVFNFQKITFNVEIPSFEESIIINATSITLVESLFVQDYVIIETTSEPINPYPNPPILNEAVSITENSAVLSWSQPTCGTGCTITDFHIFLVRATDNSYVFNDRVGNVLSFTVTGLEPNSGYKASVLSITDDGVEGNKDSNVVTWTTSEPGTTPPEPDPTPEPPTDLEQEVAELKLIVADNTNRIGIIEQILQQISNILRGVF